MIYAGIQSHTTLRWIYGNHDTDKQLWFDNLFKSPWVSSCLHAKVERLGGLNIAGLGGVFREKIWHPKKGICYATRSGWKAKHNTKRFMQGYLRDKRKHESTIWPEDYAQLLELNSDILVLHEAPSCHKHGVKALDDLAAALGVRLIVHGHHHQFYTSVLDNGIAVVGLGLAQIAHMNVEDFCSAKNSKEIFKAFEFIKNKGDKLP